MNEVVEKNYFQKLSEEEKDFAHRVPILAAILVAGADDDVEQIEKKVAAQVTYFKGHTTSQLKEFYTEVSEDFHEKFETMMTKYPANAAERNPAIREDLARLDEIIPKMDRVRGDEFVDSILSVARQVAEASGGLLGYANIKPAEQRALSNLKLILDK